MDYQIDKYTVNMYRVYSKKRDRELEIMVFPEIKYMWAFDPHPMEEEIMIDGDKEAMSALGAAYATLVSRPSVIIYFPIKSPSKSGGYCQESLHLVMMRPELQFKMSEWFAIKKKLDRNHFCGSHVFAYNKGMINEEWKKIEEAWDEKAQRKKAKKLYRERIMGDTIFMVVPKYFCYNNHHYITEGLATAKEDNNEITWCSVGRIFSDECIAEFTGNEEV